MYVMAARTQGKQHKRNTKRSCKEQTAEAVYTKSDKHK